MAIERTAWRPRIDEPPIRCVRFAGAALTDGNERHRIEGVVVTITDPARTIVDCFRYRAKVGIDVAIDRMRNLGAIAGTRGATDCASSLCPRCAPSGTFRPWIPNRSTLSAGIYWSG